MPRSGVNGTYSLPPGTTPQQPNTTILSAVHNAAFDDVAQTLNTIQPISYGGTGSSDLSLNALNLAIKDNIDQTKRVAFDVSSVTTGTTRTITVGDADLTLRPQGWEKIGYTVLGSTTASIDFTGLSGYRALRVQGSLFAATSGGIMGMRVSSDNGVSYDSGASDYVRTGAYWVGSSPGTNAGSTSLMYISAGSTNNTAGFDVPFSAELDNFGVNKFSSFRSFCGYSPPAAGPFTSGFEMGYRANSVVSNAIRFFNTAGSLQAGSWVLLEGLRL